MPITAVTGGSGGGWRRHSRRLQFIVQRTGEATGLYALLSGSERPRANEAGDDIAAADARHLQRGDIRAAPAARHDKQTDHIHGASQHLSDGQLACRPVSAAAAALVDELRPGGNRSDATTAERIRFAIGEAGGTGDDRPSGCGDIGIIVQLRDQSAAADGGGRQDEQ